MSVSEFHRDLKPQTLAVGEETLHHLLSHLEDAILVRLLSMHTTSERQRMRNPRKAYPVDPGLIPVTSAQAARTAGAASRPRS